MACEAGSLNLVVIRSTDLDRSARFFAALGVELAREIHGSGPEHLAGRVGQTNCVRVSLPLSQEGHFVDAEPLLSAALKPLRKRFGTHDPRTASILAPLGQGLHPAREMGRAARRLALTRA